MLRFPSATFVVVLFFSLLSHAGDFLFFSFDGVLVEHRSEFQGTFWTPLVLRSRAVRKEPYETIPKQAEIHVHPEVYDKNREAFPKFVDIAGDRTRQLIAMDGQTFLAGDFLYDELTSRNHFGEVVPDSLLQSYSGARSGPGYWKGMYFSLFARALAENNPNRSVHLTTAERAHSLEQWESFFSRLLLDREIARIPVRENIRSLGAYPFDKYGSKPAERAANFFGDVARDLKRVHLSDEDLRVGPDGDTREKLHLLVVAESNQQILKQISRSLEHIMTGAKSPIKVVLLNAGTEAEVRASGRPRISVIKRDGFFRKITSEELKGDLAFLSPEIEIAKAIKAGDFPRKSQSKKGFTQCSKLFP